MKQGWEIKKLGDVCEVRGGGTPSKKNPKFYVGNILWATVRDMKSEIITDTEFKITEEAVKKSSTNIIPKGNVIIATRVGLGKVCFTENDTAINQDLRGIIPKKQKQLDVGYLFQWFKSISRLIIEEGTGATVQGVKLPFIKNLPLPLPPLSEQQRIVSILDECFAAIDKAKANAERCLSLSKDLFESYLQGVFENGDWEIKNLNEITEVKDGTHDSPKYIKEGIPFVTQKNIKPDGLTLADTKFISKVDHEKFYKRSNVTYGDILISMIGANRGMAAIVDDKQTFSIKNVGLIKKSENINMYFLLYHLKSPNAKKYVSDSSNGGAQEFVGLRALRSFPIPLPTLEEQQTIVRQLDALRTETQKLEAVYQKKIDDLEELKKSILQRAFAGDLPDRQAGLKISASSVPVKSEVENRIKKLI